MAPKILIKSCRLEVANFDSLQKVDMWAFGMGFSNLVNLRETEKPEIPIPALSEEGYFFK